MADVVGDFAAGCRIFVHKIASARWLWTIKRIWKKWMSVEERTCRKGISILKLEENNVFIHGSPWYNRHGWPGLKNTTMIFIFLDFSSVASRSTLESSINYVIIVLIIIYSFIITFPSCKNDLQAQYSFTYQTHNT